jgi:hypothetical protein
VPFGPLLPGDVCNWFGIDQNIFVAAHLSSKNYTGSV